MSSIASMLSAVELDPQASSDVRLAFNQDRQRRDLPTENRQESSTNESCPSSPHGLNWIANADVSSGSYRRPSLPSPSEPFQSVTACSPVASPGDESGPTVTSNEGSTISRFRSSPVLDSAGRRQMVRSGTSGSLQLSLPNPPSRFDNSSSDNTSAFGSNAHVTSKGDQAPEKLSPPSSSTMSQQAGSRSTQVSPSGVIPSDTTTFRSKDNTASASSRPPEKVGYGLPSDLQPTGPQDCPKGNSVESELRGSTKQSSSASEMQRHMGQRPTFLHHRISSLHRHGAETASISSRSDGLLSVPVTPTTEELFRSPSQQSNSSEADGYFTARPGSPADSNEMLSLPRGSSKARSLLRQERVSTSGRGDATWPSPRDYVERELATAAATAISLDDEACYVDCNHGHPSYHEPSPRGTVGSIRAPKCRNVRVDFLSQLPPELSLCIVHLLDGHTDVLSAALVSRRWRSLAMDQSVWRHLFFSQPGWAIREDAPIVLQHQGELQRTESKARRTAARAEAERLQRLQEQRKAATTSSPYLDRLAALKSWRETLHIPSFPHLAGLSLGAGAAATSSRKAGEVDIDNGRTISRNSSSSRLAADLLSSNPSSSSSITAPMSPLRSPTASTGRFGLFLSPARPAPSTPAGTRRAQEASTSQTISYFSGQDMPLPPTKHGRNESSESAAMNTSSASTSQIASRRPSVDSSVTEVVEAEEYFAASLDWIRLYIDRYILEQRWTRAPRSVEYLKNSERERSAEGSQPRPRSQLARAFSPGSRSSSTFSTSNATSGTHAASSNLFTTAGAVLSSSSTRPLKMVAKPFEPTKRFLRGHQDSVYCIRQDDGVGTGTAGKFVSGSRDRTIRVWDVETGSCKHVLRGHTASVLSLQYDDRILVSVSSDGQVFVWDFASILASSTQQFTAEHVDSPSSGCSGSTVGDAIAPPGANSSRKTDPESGALVHEKGDRLHCVLRGHTSAVLDVVFDENWIVTGSKDASVRIWQRSDVMPEPGKGSAIEHEQWRSPGAYRIFSHSGPVNAVDLQGKQVVSASGEGSMYLWDLETGSTIHRFSGHTKGLACIVFKGTTLVSGSNDQTIRVWDTVTGRCTHVLGEHYQLVRTVAYCPVRGLVVSGGYDRLIKVWHIGQKNNDSAVQAHGDSATSMNDSSERRTPQITRDDSCSNAPSEQRPEPAQPESSEPAPSSYNPHGESGSREASNTALAQPIRDIRCHRARIFDLDFNTTRIVSASEDHLICISYFGGQGIDTSLFA